MEQSKRQAALNRIPQKSVSIHYQEAQSEYTDLNLVKDQHGTRFVTPLPQRTQPPLLSREDPPFSLHRLHRRVDGAMEQGVRRLAWAMSGLAAAVMVAGSVWLTGIPADRPAAAPPWAGVAMLPAADSVSESVTHTPVAEFYLADAGNGNDDPL